MRLPSLVALLPCALTGALFVACGFNPGGAGSDDDDDTTDAAPDVDACVASGPETCEGTDQDCDGMIDEGLTAGAPCDGPDTDSCTDDMTICNAQGAVVCGNTSGDDDVELCNGADDDCDGMMDEGFMVAAQCDGADGDLCREGTFSCAPDGLSAVCSDNTGTTTEICNNADDDCDLVIDNGFDLQGDEANCGECGNACTNNLGTNTCTSGNCVPSCTNGAADCDGEPDNGCELVNTNPTCNPVASSSITVNADTSATGMLVGTTEAFHRVRLRESNGPGDVDITASIQLVSGAGTDFDLLVYCLSCGTIPLSDSTDDTIEVGRADQQGEDRSFDVFVEVRYDPTTPSTTCAQWQLVITGGVTTANRCGSAGGGP